MTNLYFAYGANINLHDMGQRCPAAKPVGAFEVRDWQLEFHSHATIQPRKGASVHGVIWDLTPDCERSLDMFEGYPIYYSKKSWDQDGLRFFFYVMNDPLTGFPNRSYIMGIADGYLQWQLPVESIGQALDRNHATSCATLQYID